AKITQWWESESFKGSVLEGTIAAHPLRGQGYDFDVPALSGHLVTDDAGTGFVHMAPSHGADDFALVQSVNATRSPKIEIPDNITDDGKYRDHVPMFAGLEIMTQKGEIGDGNFAVLKAFEEAGALVAKG